MANPILEFRFGSINNNTITEYASGLNGTSNSGCTLVDDPVMGQCIQFDGSTGYITLPALNFDFSSGFSLCCWVNYSALNNFSRIIDFGNGGANNNIIVFNNGTSNELVYANFIANAAHTFGNTATGINTNEWLHIAVTVDASGNLTIYIDGTAVANQTNAALIPQNVNRSSNFIGKSNFPDNSLFEGKMAWLSTYAEPLSNDAIIEEMNNALIERGAFRSTFPLNFALNSNNSGKKTPTLYIKSTGTPDPLLLDVNNCTHSALLLQTPTCDNPSTVSISNYHFQLRFRPGTLASNFASSTIGVALNTNDSADSSSPSVTWNIECGKDSNTGEDYISLLATGGTLPQIKASEVYGLTLSGVEANPMGGARSSNVQFSYNNIGFSATGSPLLASRLQSINIVDHEGQKNIPLVAGIIGSGTLLNDGSTPNDVLVSITNTSTQDITLSTEAHQQTQFIIGLQGQQQGTLAEWALAEMELLTKVQCDWGVLGITGQANSTSIPLTKPLCNTLTNTPIIITPPGSKAGSGTPATISGTCDQGATSITLQNSQNVSSGSIITLSVNGQPAWLAPAPNNTNTSVSWSIVNSQQTVLAKDDSLVFRLSNIKSQLPAGLSAITIQYANIPGYWDGSFGVELIKSPAVSRGSSVGIGTNKPATALDVNGTGQFADTLTLNGALNTNAPVTLTNNTGPNVTIQNLTGGKNQETGLYFKTYNTGTNDASSAIIAQDDGNGSNNLLLQTKTPDAQTNTLGTRVSITSDGNVSLNNNLTVSGTTTLSGATTINGTVNTTASVCLSNTSGPGLTIQNLTGGTGSTTGMYFKTYGTTGSQVPSSAIVVQDAGSYTNNIIFQTKQAGNINNPLQSQMMLASNGNLNITGAYSGYGISPIGSVLAYAGANTAVPAGWVICNGEAISRTTYAALFSVIGVIYGFGDQSTTFNVPDYRGQFLRGMDYGLGQDPDAGSRIAQTNGTALGDNVGSRQGDELASHTHDYQMSTYNCNTNWSGDDWGNTTQPTTATGGNETRPKNVYVNFIIRAL